MMRMTLPSKAALMLFLLAGGMVSSVGWEFMDSFEERFIPSEKIELEIITSFAVLGAVALPAADILFGEDPLYDSLAYSAVLGVSYGAKEALKLMAGRTRPDGDPQSRSFPSGHATGTGASLGYLLYMNRTRDYFHPVYLYASIPLQGLTAAGRVLSRKHYPSDVIAGLALGISVGYLVPMVSDAIFSR